MVRTLIVLALVALPVAAGNGACDSGEGLAWDPVLDATRFEVFASVSGGPFVTVAVLPPFAPQIVFDVEPTPRTWAAPELYMPELAPGTPVLFRVGHDGAPVSQPPGYEPPAVCSWNPPCAMGFAGSDPREDVLACAGFSVGIEFDESAWSAEFDAWSWE